MYDRAASPGGSSDQSIVNALISALTDGRADALLETLDLDLALAASSHGETVSRTGFATALNVVLFDQLLDRVPTGAAFVADQRARGHRIAFDHGALRTIRFENGPTGQLPAGEGALTRVLEPLGYRLSGVYPLPRLRMTGRAWVHDLLPEHLPQFFVSELHVEQFDAAFAEAAHCIFDDSHDPLDASALSLLERYNRGEAASLNEAIQGLRTIVSAFGCHHSIPDETDYAVLRTQSAEAAWIATEGNAFNHATSRVDDVAAEAERQRALGLPIKDRVETSQNGRVCQTAFRADPVVRRFRKSGEVVERRVPGSFYEIISRDIDPATRRMDLTFDSGNATGIFQMTKVT